MTNRHDVVVLRELARRVVELAAKPIQDERRELWRRLHNLDPVRPMIYVQVDMPGWECVGPDLQCEDPFLRQHEFALRQALFHDTIGDDAVIEPWITQRASFVVPEAGHWGVRPERIDSTRPGGAWKTRPAIRDLDDVKHMIVPWHEVDETKTAREVARIREALDGVMEVNLSRRPFMSLWGSHISGDLGELRGIETVMMDMIDHPAWLHELLAFMRDGILKIQQKPRTRGTGASAITRTRPCLTARSCRTPGRIPDRFRAGSSGA